MQKLAMCTVNNVEKYQISNQKPQSLLSLLIYSTGIISDDNICNYFLKLIQN